MKAPSAWHQVCVVGLGLIGGSLSLALRARCPHLRLVGIDREGGRCLPLDELHLVSDDGAVQRALRSADSVFLAVPVEAMGYWIDKSLEETGPQAVVSDCGSTKRQIAEHARRHRHRARFVPGHPMAGALLGTGEASTDLFVDRPWILCPGEGAEAAVAALEECIELLGGRPIRMSAEAHDRAVAHTSHVPRIVASCLSTLAERQGAMVAAGPAFERLLRAAGGDAAMWASILSTNKDEIARALREAIEALARCAEALEHGSATGAVELLQAAERTRERFTAEQLAGRRLP